MNDQERREIESLKVGDVKWQDGFTGEWLKLDGEPK